MDLILEQDVVSLTDFARQTRKHTLELIFRPWKRKAGWRVLYTIDEKEKRVTVLQVRHEHRSWLLEVDETEE